MKQADLKIFNIFISTFDFDDCDWSFVNLLELKFFYALNTKTT